MLKIVFIATLTLSTIVCTPSIAKGINGIKDSLYYESKSLNPRTGRWVTFSEILKPKNNTVKMAFALSADQKIFLKKEDFTKIQKITQPILFKSIPSRIALTSLPKAIGGPEFKCLTEALYFEARGEGVSGIFAVAEVIINRRDSLKFPNSVCKVITQGAHRRNKCQFSYKCDGYKEVFREHEAKEFVAKIAKIALERRAPELTSGATFYHAKNVQPSWAKSFRKTTTIGNHYFYSG